MVGNNRLILCHATMIEMAQQWVDANINPPPKVESVSVLQKPDSYNPGEFEIKLTERPAEVG